MPDRHVIVTDWDDIDAAPDLNDREKQRVATIFSEQSWERVVWCPEWLLEETDVVTVEASDHLAVGDIEDYSEKAWKLTQPHLDREVWADGAEFLPKSQVVVFERAPGTETIATPQAGLSAFAGGGDA